MLAAPTGRVKDFGLDGGSSPDWVVKVVEEPYGFQVSSTVGAKVGTGAIIASKEGRLENEIERAGADKKNSPECNKTEPLRNTRLLSEIDRVISIEKKFQKDPKETQKTLKTNLPAKIQTYGFIKNKHFHAVKHVCILSESVPTWLAVADGWGAELIEIYMDQPERGQWFIDGLGMKKRVSIIPTVVGVRRGVWRSSSDSVVLIQGTAKFVQKMVTGLSAIGVKSDSHKIIIASSQKIRNLDLQFKFQRLAHDKLGGVSNDIGNIGFSTAVQLARPKPSDLGVRRVVVGNIKVAVGGKPIDDPQRDGSCRKDNLKSPFDYHSPLDFFMDEFEAPSVWSSTGWVQRDLSGEEFLSTMDIPSSVIAYATNAGVIKKGEHGSVLGSPPLKILQEVGDMIYGTRNISSENASTSEPKEEPSYILHSEIDGLSEIYHEINQAKVAKNDEAEADFEMWNKGIITKPSDWRTDWLIVGADHDYNYEIKYFDSLRKIQHRRFITNVENSFYKYMSETYKADSRLSKKEELKLDLWEWERDKEAGLEALAKVRRSSFWDWDQGSFPHFWRWQPEIQKDVRDGTKLWIQGELPNNTGFKQKLPKDEHVVAKILEKLSKVRGRGYIGPNWVRSLTSYFHVPKGGDDIRMVYDLTASGLNDALWVPSFWMPSVGNVLECCTHSSWFGDVDAGEMFLNFPLDLAIRPYCGVDVSWMEEGKKTTWESWHRMAMGMKPSPWVTCRLIGWMLELVVGDKKDAKNPFRWDTVILNLPGDKDYDPNLPRVFKWNDMLQSIACDVKVFVDDFRVTGPSYTATTLATHRLETRMGYLGIQDATRKRRKVTQRPGEWTGSIVTAVEDVGLFVTVTKIKWSKVQNILKKWEEKFSNDTQPRVNLKDLERDVGFLVHISMAFPSVKPFLRGFYLSMNSWRQDRDSAGWKMSWRSYRVFLAMGRR